MRKKLIAMILAGMMALAMAGCGDTSDHAKSTTAAEAETAAVTVTETATEASDTSATEQTTSAASTGDSREGTVKDITFRVPAVWEEDPDDDIEYCMKTDGEGTFAVITETGTAYENVTEQQAESLFDAHISEIGSDEISIKKEETDWLKNCPYPCVLYRGTIEDSGEQYVMKQFFVIYNSTLYNFQIVESDGLDTTSSEMEAFDNVIQSIQYK